MIDEVRDPGIACAGQQDLAKCFERCDFSGLEYAEGQRPGPRFLRGQQEFDAAQRKGEQPEADRLEESSSLCIHNLIPDLSKLQRQPRGSSGAGQGESQ